MLFDLFREELASARAHRLRLNYLLQVSTSGERAVLAAAALAILCFVAWTFFGSVERSVTIKAHLIDHSDRHEAVTREPGRLVEHLVKVGDQVVAGQAIARQTVPELDRKIMLLRERESELSAQAETGQDNGSIQPLLDLIRIELLQTETLKSARSVIIVPADGRIAALIQNPGTYLQAAEPVAQILSDRPESSQVLYFASETAFEHIHLAAPAEIECEDSDGNLLRTTGEVVSAEPMRLRPHMVTHSGPARSRSLVAVQFDELSKDLKPGTTEPDLSCRLDIVHGKSTPASFFNYMRS